MTDADQQTTTYNGWVNYETWCAHLWLTNDEGSYNQTMALIESAADSQQAAAALRDFVRDNNPLLDDASLYSDLLGRAMGQVEWLEIVEGLQEQ